MQGLRSGCCPRRQAKALGTSADAAALLERPGCERDRWIYLEGLKFRLALPSVDLGSNDTGLRLWVASLILAGHLVQHGRKLVHGLSVVELGAGVTALPTIVAARSGAARCLATDYNASLVDAARINLAANEAGSAADAGILEWEAAVAAAEAGPGSPRWEVVLFADTVYTLEMGTWLARCIDATLARQGKAIGVLSVFRVGSAEFVQTMARMGFAAEQLPINEALKAHIDTGLVLGPGVSAEQLGVVIEGLPAAGCELVCWRRRAAGLPLPPDDTDKVFQRLAGDLEQAERGIRMSEGFEVWE